MRPGLKLALQRGIEESWKARGVVLTLWCAGAAAGLVSASPWVGSWARALHERGAGQDLARGFELTLLCDLLRAAGPGIGALRGWAWGAGLAYLLLAAILQGGAIRILAAPRSQRCAELFGEGCTRHAAALVGFAGLSLAAAAGCGGLAWAVARAATAVGRGEVDSMAALGLRLAAGASALLLFAFLQVILELARLDRVTTRDAGWLLPLAMAWRFVARRPLCCLAIYGAACGASVAGLGVALALVRGAGSLERGWGVGVWAAAQLFLLLRWACRVGMWVGLGVVYGAVPWRAD